MKSRIDRLTRAYQLGREQLAAMPSLPCSHTWISTEEWVGGPCAVPIHSAKPGTLLAVTPSLHNYNRWRVTHTGCGAAIGDALQLDEALALLVTLSADDVEASVAGDDEALDRVADVLDGVGQ